MNTKGIDILYDMIILSLLLLALANNWFFLVFAAVAIIAFVVRFIRRKIRRKKKAKARAAHTELAMQKQITSTYGVIVADITFALLQKYPDAIWLWENPAEAKRLIMTGFSTEIMIWHAPYNRAIVEVNYQTKRLKRLTFHTNRFSDLLFEDVPNESFRENKAFDTVAEEATEKRAAKRKVENVDYSLIAYQWVTGNEPILYQWVRDSLDEEMHNLQVLPEKLPQEKESWAEVVGMLSKEFDAELLPDDAGIMLNF